MAWKGIVKCFRRNDLNVLNVRQKLFLNILLVLNGINNISVP